MLLALLGALVAIIVTGHGTTEVLALMTGPAVSGLLGLLLAKRTSALQVTADQTAHQTDCVLNKRLDVIQGLTADNGAKLDAVVPPPAVRPVEGQG